MTNSTTSTFKATTSTSGPRRAARTASPTANRTRPDRQLLPALPAATGPAADLASATQPRAISHLSVADCMNLAPMPTGPRPAAPGVTPTSPSLTG